MSWKRDLRKASESGGELTNREIRQIARATPGVSRSEVTSRAQDQGYISSPAQQTNTNTNTNNDQAGGDSGQGSSSTAELTTLFQNLYDFQSGIAQIGANANINSTTIRAEADKEIAKIDADSRKYGYELGLQGTKYTADKESEWRQSVANIEVKGKLDLQPIINAGLQRVAEIEGQSARDVAETTGSYSLKSMQERTAADRAIGKMQLAGGMYGLIGAAFG